MRPDVPAPTKSEYPAIGACAFCHTDMGTSVDLSAASAFSRFMLLHPMVATAWALFLPWGMVVLVSSPGSDAVASKAKFLLIRAALAELRRRLRFKCAGVYCALCMPHSCRTEGSHVLASVMRLRWNSIYSNIFE